MALDIPGSLFTQTDVRETPSAEIQLATITTDIDMDGNNMINLATPVNDSDAATKKYVDDEITDNVAIPTGTYYWRTHGHAFRPVNVGSQSQTATVSGGIIQERMSPGEDGGYYTCAVNLPNGAVMTSATVNGSGSYTWYLTRAGTEIASAAEGSADTLNVTVDNNNYNYYFSVQAQDADAIDWAEITYTL